MTKEKLEKISKLMLWVISCSRDWFSYRAYLSLAV